MAGGVNSVSPHEYEPGPPERASWRAPDRPRDTQNGRRLHVGVPRSHPLQTRKSQGFFPEHWKLLRARDEGGQDVDSAKFLLTPSSAPLSERESQRDHPPVGN